MPTTFTVYGADGRRIIRQVNEAYATEFAQKLHGETGEELAVVADGPLDAVGVAEAEQADDAPTKASLMKLNRKKLDKAAKDAGVAEPEKLASKEAVADAVLALAGEQAPEGELVAFYAQWDNTDETELLTTIAGWTPEDGPTDDDKAAILAHEEQHLRREAVLEALTP